MTDEYQYPHPMLYPKTVFTSYIVHDMLKYRDMLYGFKIISCAECPADMMYITDWEGLIDTTVHSVGKNDRKLINQLLKRKGKEVDHAN